MCAILFGEFEVNSFGNFGGDDEEEQENGVDQSSFAFSIVCIFFTVMYAGKITGMYKVGSRTSIVVIVICFVQRNKFFKQDLHSWFSTFPTLY